MESRPGVKHFTFEHFEKYKMAAIIRKGLISLYLIKSVGCTKLNHMIPFRFLTKSSEWICTTHKRFCLQMNQTIYQQHQI